MSTGAKKTAPLGGLMMRTEYGRPVVEVEVWAEDLIPTANIIIADAKKNSPPLKQRRSIFMHVPFF
jgi:hypothetical protein